MTSSTFMLKKINLSTEIAILNKSLSIKTEKKPIHVIMDKMSSASLLTSEIGLPFANNVVGMHSLIADHSKNLGQSEIFIIAVICSGVDAILHYTLLFDVYKKAIGLPQEMNEDQVQTLKSELTLLNNKLMLGIQTKPPSPKEWEELKDSYNRLFEHKNDLTNQSIIYKGLIYLLLGMIFLIFAGLRVSGGYFILINFVGAIGISALAVSVPGFIIMWSLIALYAFEGYQTRKSPIADFFFPLKIALFDDLKENYLHLKRIMDNPQNSDMVDVNDVNSPIQSCDPLLNRLKWLGLFISEIGFPLVNDFIGLNLLLMDHAAFLEKSMIYFISALASYIDLTVFYAQIFPVLKKSIGLYSESSEAMRESRDQLRSLNEIADKLLNPIKDNHYELKLNQFFAHYDEVKTLKNEALEEKCIKTLIQGALLSVFVLLRVSGGYFILKNLFLTLGVGAFGLTPVGLGITWGLIALYAYRGFGTRKTAIADLLYPLRKIEFSALENKHQQLRASVPGTLFHKNAHQPNTTSRDIHSNENRTAEASSVLRSGTL